MAGSDFFQKSWEQEGKFIYGRDRHATVEAIKKKFAIDEVDRLAAGPTVQVWYFCTCPLFRPAFKGGCNDFWPSIAYTSGSGAVAKQTGSRRD